MIVVEAFRGKSAVEHPVEIVERKGTGHPDQMCDSMMEAISVALSREYIREFGAILHHNVDKGLLSAGRVVKRFGGGRVIKPMELTIGDRATFSAGGKKVPVADIAISAAKDWIARNMRLVDPERHMKYRVVLAPGSEELADIFRRRGKVLGANDTSAAVGYHPLSPTEQAVLDLERHLNSGKFKTLHPETGEDVKVMAMRRGDEVDFTVAMPLLAEFVKSEKDYFAVKSDVERGIAEFLESKRGGFRKITFGYNALDEKGRGGLGGVYLSLLGTSAEDADSGQVGRGNRVNGLISVNRPMGTEAAAGKNPVSHVGKIYNVLAHKIAKEIYHKTEGVKEVYVTLLSRIGTPIDTPRMACVQVVLERGRRMGEISGIARAVIEGELKNINKLCLDLAKGKYPVS